MFPPSGPTKGPGVVPSKDTEPAPASQSAPHRCVPLDLAEVDGCVVMPQADPGVKRRNFVHVLGVDLGGGKGKTTALATLRADGASATVVDIAPRNGAPPFYDAALLETIRAHGEDTLLCVDAPLTLPPCLRCTVPVCPGQVSCVDPAVVEMRALAAEASEARDAGGFGLRGNRDTR